MKEKHIKQTASPTEAEISKADITAWLVDRVGRQAGIPADEIDIQRPFLDYGLRSATTMDLLKELGQWLNRPLGATLAYDYPSIEALSQYLARHMAQHFAVEREIAARRSASGQAAQADPIAIIGLGCRFPKARNPEEFWQLLRDGVDATGEIPASRWPPTEKALPRGGFIDDVDRFDPAFFGISPRELEIMDPQQRVMLEVGWEALENAGIDAESLAGSQTGVFVGICHHDYYNHVLPVAENLYFETGNAFSISANRLSYLWDLRGPSKAIDTACSSALVSLHDACLSLQRGECDLALAGGVNLMLHPGVTERFVESRLLSPEGRCKTFDAGADGYARGEGCGVVVLKRLRDAQEEGDTILALVKGTAVNQDGRSNGLTAPNGPAQQAVIRRALANAGVGAEEISYVETHGTGTPLGDPIEFNSLKAVLMPNRAPNETCHIGSVKTNIGHLEAAAGVAGVIKTVLALQHREIPPHLHLEELNPHLDIWDSPISIPTQLTPWPNARRLAGVSSFGYGGTNAHVILEEAPVGWGELANPNKDVSGDEFVGVRSSPQPTTFTERPLHLLTLSAKSQEALGELARSYETYLAAHPDVPFADICFTANTGRAHFEHRIALVAESSEAAAERLHATDYIAGQLNGQIGKTRGKIAFLFTGQGSEYPNMGRQLYETCPLFRENMDRCDAILRPWDVPILDLLYPASPNLDTALSKDMSYLQPSLFALEYSLARLWQSWGITPGVVMGHSVGEYVAACVAGVFDLESALKLVAARGCLMQTCPEGRMLAVSVGEEQAMGIIAPFEGAVSIATINSPESVVISGKPEAIESILASLAGNEEIETKLLPIPRASHSPLMEPILDRFGEVASSITYAKPGIALCSNVTGKMETQAVTTAEYWVRHLRQPVRFAASVKTLHEQGFDTFIEIGPKPALLGMARLCLPDDADGKRVWLPSLREGQNDWRQMLQSLGEWHARGGAVDWAALDKGYTRRKVSLPTYPFQRRRYWIEMAQNEETPPAPPAIPSPTLVPDTYAASPPSAEELLRGFEAVALREPEGVESGWIPMAMPSAFGQDDLAPLIERIRAARQIIVLRRREGGEHFCLGMDLDASGFDETVMSGILEQFQQLAEAIRSAPMPVICVIEGACRGGGMLFPSLATIVLATEDASFGFPEIRRGKLPGVVSVAAKRRISEAQCQRYMLTGDPFDAKTAETLGLVDFVGSAKEVEEELKRLLGRFHTVEPTLLASGKKDMPGATEDTALVAMGGLDYQPPPRDDASKPLVEVKHRPDTGVLVITLDDPAHSNTMNVDIAQDLRRAVEAAKALNDSAGDSVRAVLFQGNGDHFCSGANPYKLVPYLKGLPVVTSAHVMHEIYRSFLSIRDLGVPVVCALHGKVVGGGFAAMLNADYRIAAESTVFNHGNLPRGACPGMLLSNNLERMTGLNRAMDLYLNDYTLTAEQAKRIGLIQEVVPDAAAAKARALRMAEELAGFPPMGLEATLDLMRPPLDEARFAREIMGFARCNIHGNAFSGDWKAPERYMDDASLAGPGNVHSPATPAPAVAVETGRTQSQSRNVGIHAMELYFPNFMVSQKDMEELHGVSGKYTVGLLQESITFCGDDEDAVSMALTVVLRLMKRHGIGWDRIGRIEVGTESLVDRSKSIKTHLMELFERHGQCNIEGVDTYTACYGGTAALLNTVGWCQSEAWDGRFAIVVAVDIADLSQKYAFLNGAGAVAMLVGPDAPVVMLPERGSHMIHNWDFYKPVGWKESFPVMPDGQHTVEVYMDCLSGCQKAIGARTQGINLLRNDDYFVFHSTGSYLAKRGFERLAKNAEPGLSRQELQDLFQQKAYHGTLLTKQIGSTYTAAVYIALYSLFLNRFDEISGKTICAFSYGGGSASTMYRLRVLRPPAMDRAVPERLEKRARLRPDQYLALADRYSSAYGRFDFAPGNRGDQQPDIFYLERVDEWGRRFYTDVSRVEENFLPGPPSARIEPVRHGATVQSAPVPSPLLEPRASEPDKTSPNAISGTTAGPGPGKDPTTAMGDFMEGLQKLLPEGQRDRLRAHIQSELNRLLGFEPDEPIDFQKGFFELGMDSLMVVELRDRLLATLTGCSLPTTSLFKYPALDTLVDHLFGQLESTRAGVHAQTAPTLEALPRQGRVPLSIAQQELWPIINQSEAHNRTYTLSLTLRIRGKLHADILRAALDEIVRRHEMLRTVFHEIGGQPGQVILSKPVFPLSIREERNVPATEAEWDRELIRLTEREAEEPLDLSKGPLVRGSLWEMGPDDQALLIILHHFIADVWSIGILKRELALLYDAFLRDKPSPLPEPEVQYADFAHWQQRSLTREQSDARLAYWEKWLSVEPPPLELPTDRPRPAVETGLCRSLPFHLSPELTRKLTVLGRQSDVTLFMTMMTAFAIVIRRWSGQDEIVVGAPFANRSHRKLEPLIGWFAQALSIRLEFQGNLDFPEVLAQVREANLSALANQDISPNYFIKTLQPKRNFLERPLYRVLLNLVPDNLTQPFRLGESMVTPFELNSKIRPDLLLNFWEEKSGNQSTVNGMWRYKTELFDTETIAGVAKDFQALLEAVAANPAQSLDKLLPVDVDGQPEA